MEILNSAIMMFEINSESCTDTPLESLYLSIHCPSSITILKKHLLFHQSTLQGANVQLGLGCFALNWLLLLIREAYAKSYSHLVLYLAILN